MEKRKERRLEMQMDPATRFTGKAQQRPARHRLYIRIATHLNLMRWRSVAVDAAVEILFGSLDSLPLVCSPLCSERGTQEEAPSAVVDEFARAYHADSR